MIHSKKKRRNFCMHFRLCCVTFGSHQSSFNDPFYCKVISLLVLHVSYEKKSTIGLKTNHDKDSLIFHRFCKEKEICKVRIFWEDHKIWKNLPLKIWSHLVKSNFKWKFFSNFVAFSEYPNFKEINTLHGWKIQLPI